MNASKEQAIRCIQLMNGLTGPIKVREEITDFLIAAKTRLPSEYAYRKALTARDKRALRNSSQRAS